ncbi:MULTISPECIES: DNA polymerase III subunit chi [Pseudomonas]|uniref:DNA polymerase III subunit chi n=1 Tax=Pseudomonas TaxID=286 RepID=UPI001C4E4344|nr:DNA polymerase III subunit chi [Pseudomonas sp. D1HM]MBW0235386.1 DNA polymerase III subunit chi [Pseudomonas sp. D1HM]
MDTPNSQQKAAHLLNDLESIRKLLGDDGLQPPLLTDMISDESTPIPLLSEMIGEEPAPPPAAAPAPKAEKAPDALLVHLDKELRTAAQAIMQDVINDFAPHIETEIKRRLDAHMERLLSQHQS